MWQWHFWEDRGAQWKLGWSRCETEWGQADPQDVNKEALNIKAKPGQSTEETDRRRNSRFREEFGPYGSGSGGLEGLHPGKSGVKAEEEKRKEGLKKKA